MDDNAEASAPKWRPGKGALATGKATGFVGRDYAGSLFQQCAGAGFLLF